MTAPLAASQRGSVGSQLSHSQANTLRALLLADAATKVSSISQYATAMASSSADTTGLDRAIYALHMYRAREAIEEIGDALARVEAGRYGACQACGRSIPFEQLKAYPQARFCAACPALVGPPADRSAGPRFDFGRGERTGIPPPLRSPRQLDRPAFRETENARAKPVAP